MRLCIFILLVIAFQCSRAQLLNKDSIICVGDLPPYLSGRYGLYGSPRSIVAEYKDLTDLCASSKHTVTQWFDEHGEYRIEDQGENLKVRSWSINLTCSDNALKSGPFASSVFMDVNHYLLTRRYCLERCACVDTWGAFMQQLGNVHHILPQIMLEYLQKTNDGLNMQGLTKECNGLSGSDCIKRLELLGFPTGVLGGMPLQLSQTMSWRRGDKRGFTRKDRVCRLRYGTCLDPATQRRTQCTTQRLERGSLPVDWSCAADMGRNRMKLGLNTFSRIP